jgi:hypothetical protein
MHRLLNILKGKAGLMAGGTRRSATLRELSTDVRIPLDTCASYLRNHAPYLCYHRHLAQGLPVATGVIEGACRHLVKDRMDVTGARWSLTGAEAVLRLRALKSSHDFEEYWTFHEACEYERNHKKLYAGGKLPAVFSSKQNQKRDHLKVPHPFHFTGFFTCLKNFSEIILKGISMVPSASLISEMYFVSRPGR